MAYFTNPRTEEELKEQFRQLLIKYDYRNPKNEKLIAEIRKEYEQTLKQIKYDNGYRTAGQQIKEGITGYINKQSAEYEKEEARKRALRNKPYTKQDLSNLIEEQKRFINGSVQKILVAQNHGYEDLKEAIINAKRGKDIYDVYAGNRIHEMKERLEYCVLALAGKNELQAEIMLSKVEDQLGAYVKQVFQQYEKNTVDPIIEMKAMQWASIRGKQIRYNERVFKVLKVLSYIPGVLAIMIGLPLILDGGLVIVAIGIAWILFARFLHKTNTRMRQRKKRIRTEEEQYTADSWISGIAHFLSHLFR